jgi:hypothetical protein
MSVRPLAHHGTAWWACRWRIDRTTLTPNWYGDRLDPDPILDALLPRRIPTAA